MNYLILQGDNGTQLELIPFVFPLSIPHHSVAFCLIDEIVRTTGLRNIMCYSGGQIVYTDGEYHTLGSCSTLSGLQSKDNDINIIRHLCEQYYKDYCNASIITYCGQDAIKNIH